LFDNSLISSIVDVFLFKLIIVILFFIAMSVGYSCYSSTTSALGSASGALNALINDGLASIAGQYAGSLLPDSMQKYFKICYKKNKPTPSSDFDPCSLLDMGLIDVCKTLPELPGYTKLNSIDQEFDLLKTLTSIPSSGPGSFVKASGF